MEDFGLPTWGSYLIFAVATIILGAVLGLILVCIIDFFYPPKYSHCKKTDNNKLKKSDQSSGDELADEDIKDDLLDDASQSESDENNSTQSEELEEEEEEVKDKSNPSSPNIKKRKPRKADWICFDAALRLCWRDSANLISIMEILIMDFANLFK